MKNILALVLCLSFISNYHAVKSSGTNSGKATVSTKNNYFESTVGSYSEGKFNIGLNYNKKDETQCKEVAEAIYEKVNSLWNNGGNEDYKYQVNLSNCSVSIKEGLQKYLKKYKRTCFIVHTPKLSDMKTKKKAQVAKLFKSDNHDLNGFVKEITSTNESKGTSKNDYLVEVAAKHNIFKTNGVNITFYIYKRKPD